MCNSLEVITHFPINKKAEQTEDQLQFLLDSSENRSQGNLQPQNWRDRQANTENHRFSGADGATGVSTCRNTVRCNWLDAGGSLWASLRINPLRRPSVGGRGPHIFLWVLLPGICQVLTVKAREKSPLVARKGKHSVVLNKACPRQELFTRI